MRGVRGAAAVAEDKNVPVVLERAAQQLDHLRRSFRGDGVERGLLRLDIITDPLVHIFGNADCSLKNAEERGALTNHFFGLYASFSLSEVIRFVAGLPFDV